MIIKFYLTGEDGTTPEIWPTEPNTKYLIKVK